MLCLVVNNYVTSDFGLQMYSFFATDNNSACFLWPKKIKKGFRLIGHARFQHTNTHSRTIHFGIDLARVHEQVTGLIFIF